MTDKLWYAYEYDREDCEWGTGSYDEAEAMQWLADQIASGNEEAQLAVIDESGDEPMCIDEIRGKDL